MNSSYSFPRPRFSFTTPALAPTHRSGPPRAPVSPRPQLLGSLLAAFTVFVALPITAAAYVDPTTGLPSASNVTRRADIPDKNWMPGHRGVDLAARTGQDILAAEDGVVAFTGVVAGVPVVSVDHADGIRTTYQPVHATVRAGEKVKEGETIGRMAAPAGDHAGLHWGARTGKDTYINPLSLLDAPQIRLKPVTPEGAPGRRRS